MRVPAALALGCALAACNSNTSAGADREAHRFAEPGPAPQMGAADALRGVAPEAIGLETMSDADIASLGERAGNCRFLTTEVAKPSLVYAKGRSATLKLNGKLITLPSTGLSSYADAAVDVGLRPAEGEGNAGLPAQVMILRLPGAADEHGFRGYLQCT